MQLRPAARHLLDSAGRRGARRVRFRVYAWWVSPRTHTSAPASVRYPSFS